MGVVPYFLTSHELKYLTRNMTSTNVCSLDPAKAPRGWVGGRVGWALMSAEGLGVFVVGFVSSGSHLDEHILCGM